MLVAHWCNVEGHAPVYVLDVILQNRAVVKTGPVASYENTQLACPAKHAALLEHRVPLAIAVAGQANSPAAMCSLIVARRHETAVAKAAFGALRELAAPSLGGALRCLRPDLQRFVASTSNVIARACVDARPWLQAAVGPRWDVPPASRTHNTLQHVVRLAAVKGKIVQKSHASLALGGKLGVYWLPDDKLLIFLLLLFGPPAFFAAPPPCLPPPLSTACQPPWRNAISFSKSTPSPKP